MNPDQEISPIIVSLSVLWVVCVSVFYLWSNTGYYNEKIGAFGNFFLKILGVG